MSEKNQEGVWELVLTRVLPEYSKTDFVIFDSVIVGGGPAGLSAAIYLSRFNRKVVGIDRGFGGRWRTREVNENYLGFPKGIKTVLLRERGKLQAIRFGAQFGTEDIIEIKKEQGVFVCVGKNTYRSKTIVLATGVIDIFPQFSHFEDYIGKSMFWCITCDGYKTRGKRVLIIGKDDDAACTALQFLNFTKTIVLLVNCEEKSITLSERWKKNLKKAGIPVMKGRLKEVFGKNGQVEKVEAEEKTFSVDFIFNQQGIAPNIILAKKLGVNLDKKGYILVDSEQRTSVVGVYAAGDVTKPFSHQIVSAVYEGAAAGEAINYDLYAPFQKI